MFLLLLYIYILRLNKLAEFRVPKRLGRNLLQRKLTSRCTKRCCQERRHVASAFAELSAAPIASTLSTRARGRRVESVTTPYQKILQTQGKGSRRRAYLTNKPLILVTATFYFRPCKMAELCT